MMLCNRMIVQEQRSVNIRCCWLGPTSVKRTDSVQNWLDKVTNIDGWVNVNSLTVNHVPEKLHDIDPEITFGELGIQFLLFEVSPAFLKGLICKVSAHGARSLALNLISHSTWQLEKVQVVSSVIVGILSIEARDMDTKLLSAPESNNTLARCWFRKNVPVTTFGFLVERSCPRQVASSGWPLIYAVPGQMTYLVASWGDSISPDGFLPSILLLVVIIIAVVIVVVTVVLVVVVGEGFSGNGSLPSGRDLTGNEDPTDEDGDNDMGDLTGGSLFLGGVGRKCDPKANVVVISQTYLRHLFEEGNLSAHIILRSHVPSWTGTADFQVALEEADFYAVIFRLLGNQAMLLLTSLF
ncbi:hypothetical protein Tco_0191128 [Tanacetum coccineum]